MRQREPHAFDGDPRPDQIMDRYGRWITNPTAPRAPMCKQVLSDERPCWSIEAAPWHLSKDHSFA